VALLSSKNLHAHAEMNSPPVSMLVQGLPGESLRSLAPDARTLRRAHLLTPVNTCGHRLPVESFEEPLAARVACRAGRAAAHHGGRAAGWTQAWHRTCESLLHRENRKHSEVECVVALTTGSGSPPLHGGSSTHGTVPDRGCGTVKKWWAMDDDYSPWYLFGLDDAVRRHGGVSVVGGREAARTRV